MVLPRDRGSDLNSASIMSLLTARKMISSPPAVHANPRAASMAARARNCSGVSATSSCSVMAATVPPSRSRPALTSSTATISVNSVVTCLWMVVPCSARRASASTRCRLSQRVTSPFDFVLGPGAPRAIWPAGRQLMSAAAPWHPDLLFSLTTTQPKYPSLKVSLLRSSSANTWFLYLFSEWAQEMRSVVG